VRTFRDQVTDAQVGMGRQHLFHLGGYRIFSCIRCQTFLTNRDELMSTRFTGSTGRAFLFNKVVNINYSETQDRVMLTGRHIVRDVTCKSCQTKLGWIYEYATEENQRYKEGKVILERALVNESDGLEEYMPHDGAPAEQVEAVAGGAIVGPAALQGGLERLDHQIAAVAGAAIAGGAPPPPPPPPQRPPLPGEEGVAGAAAPPVPEGAAGAPVPNIRRGQIPQEPELEARGRHIMY